MSESSGAPDTLPPQQLRELLHGGKKIVIVDVRSPEEFAGGHLVGAVNIPADQLAAHASVLPKEATIVTVCHLGGPRSCNAAAQLRGLGFDQAIPLRGGAHALARRQGMSCDATA